MDDKTKHRIVGIVVIAAFLVILLPALFKNNFWGESGKVVEQQKYAQDERPVIDSTEPIPSTASESENFQSSQIAQVSLEQANKLEEQPVAIASDEPVSTPIAGSGAAVMSSSQQSLSVTSTESTQPVAAPEPVAKPAMVTPPPPKPEPVVEKPKPVVPPKPVVKTVQVKKVTSVPLVNVCFQLGTFANANNAQLLVGRLKAKGFFAAKTTLISLPNGKKVQRVSYCKSMARAEIVQARSKLAQMVGTTPLIIVTR